MSHVSRVVYLRLLCKQKTDWQVGVGGGPSLNYNCNRLFPNINSCVVTCSSMQLNGRNEYFPTVFVFKRYNWLKRACVCHSYSTASSTTVPLIRPFRANISSPDEMTNMQPNPRGGDVGGGGSTIDVVYIV